MAVPACVCRSSTWRARWLQAGDAVAPAALLVLHAGLSLPTVQSLKRCPTCDDRLGFKEWRQTRRWRLKKGRARVAGLGVEAESRQKKQAGTGSAQRASLRAAVQVQNSSQLANAAPLPRRVRMPFTTCLEYERWASAHPNHTGTPMGVGGGGGNSEAAGPFTAAAQNEMLFPSGLSAVNAATIHLKCSQTLPPNCLGGKCAEPVLAAAVWGGSGRRLGGPVNRIGGISHRCRGLLPRSILHITTWVAAVHFSCCSTQPQPIAAGYRRPVSSDR